MVNNSEVSIGVLRNGLKRDWLCVGKKKDYIHTIELICGARSNVSS